MGAPWSMVGSWALVAAFFFSWLLPLILSELALGNKGGVVAGTPFGKLWIFDADDRALKL